MPPFPKPKFAYDYDPATEVARLRGHRAARGIPARRPESLLIATWNLANLGQQQRLDRDRQLIAEMLGWFDLVALQEVKDNFGDLIDLQQRLGEPWDVLMSDPSGNDERLAFLYDSSKLTLLEKIGEIGVSPSEYDHVKLKGIKRKFGGFDRSPYLGTWQFGRFSFLITSVHLFFGSSKKADVERRALETFAVARWADLRAKSAFSFTRNIIALGDFNMPRAEPGDAIFRALTAKGLELPGHSTRVASSIANDSQYDQIAFLPGATKEAFTGKKGVFDFDAVVFHDLWQRSPKDFRAFVRYHLSDHRPMWLELQP